MQTRWMPADLARAIAAALLAEDRPDGEVTLLITDDEAVAASTAVSRRHGPTDVLSSPRRNRRPASSPRPRWQRTWATSSSRCLSPAARPRLGRPLSDELRLLAVHGTLHLLGYDHAEPEEEATCGRDRMCSWRDWRIADGKSADCGRRSTVNAFLRSFRFAFEGIAYVLRTQRNVRVHVVVAGLVIAAGISFG